MTMPLIIRRPADQEPRPHEPLIIRFPDKVSDLFIDGQWDIKRRMPLARTSCFWDGSPPGGKSKPAAYGTVPADGAQPHGIIGHLIGMIRQCVRRPLHIKCMSGRVMKSEFNPSNKERYDVENNPHHRGQFRNR